MLKKTIRRLGALAMVLAMAVSVFAVNASAADTDTGSDTGTGTTQTDAVVTKVVTKGQYTYAPDAEFEFTVTPAGVSEETQAAGIQNPGNGAVEIAKVKFEPTANDVGVGKTSVSNTAAITVHTEKFVNPGVYYFTVKEKVPADADKIPGVTYNSTTEKKLVVYKYGDGSIQYQFETTNAEGKVVKDDGTFENAYENTSALTITKTVSGKMGDKNKEFTFVLKINGQAAANRAAKKISGTTTTDITTDANGQFTLKHGEKLVVDGLEAAETYEVTENNYASQGYTTKIGETEKRTDGGNMTNSAKLTSAPKQVDYENNNTTSPATGVIMTIAPYALMVVLAGAFAVVFLTRRNRAE